MAYRLGELAGLVGARLVGDPDCEIDSLASLHNAGPGSISFLANYQYKRYLKQTRASAVILSPDLLDQCPSAALVSDNPYLVYAKTSRLLAPHKAAPALVAGIHATAVVAHDADIHDSVCIGPHCVIAEGVKIESHAVIGPGCIVGKDCAIGACSRLVARVTLCDGTEMGQRCLVHPGAVLGSDGFGLANDNGVWVKIEQLGRVIVGDDVEIGANTTIDRGALDDTVIEAGVKLDNQVQVGHNVRIGAHTAIAGCVGIAGSAQIGRRCTIGGAAGLAGHLEIVDDVQITGFSRVNSSVREPGVYSSGTPLQHYPQWRKNSARYRHLEEMARRLAALEQKLKEC